jgi:hypothetical protein
MAPSLAINLLLLRRSFYTEPDSAGKLNPAKDSFRIEQGCHSAASPAEALNAKPNWPNLSSYTLTL